jgi:hypothetical protein
MQSVNQSVQTAKATMCKAKTNFYFMNSRHTCSQGHRISGWGIKALPLNATKTCVRTATRGSKYLQGHLLLFCAYLEPFTSVVATQKQATQQVRQQLLTTLVLLVLLSMIYAEVPNISIDSILPGDGTTRRTWKPHARGPGVYQGYLIILHSIVAGMQVVQGLRTGLMASAFGVQGLGFQRGPGFRLTYLQRGYNILIDKVPHILVLGRAVVLLSTGNGEANVARVDGALLTS